MAESADSLQRALDVFSSGCNERKLCVNTSNSKVVIFCKRRHKRKPIFFLLNGEDVAEVDSYIGLGIKFNYNGRFCTAKKQLIDHAAKHNTLKGLTCTFRASCYSARLSRALVLTKTDKKGLGLGWRESRFSRYDIRDEGALLCC